MVVERDLNEREANFYRTKMKKIREAIERGDEEAADRHANELMDFFNIE